jgi:hypothetical protein
LRFDHEWRADGPPYAGRHRKGWRTARGGWRRVYLHRVRAEQDPAGPVVAGPVVAGPDPAGLAEAPGHRGLLPAYQDHGSLAR